MVKREQYTISLSKDEKAKIDAASGTEGFSPYARRQLLVIAGEEEYQKENKNGRRKENKK